MRILLMPVLSEISDLTPCAHALLLLWQRWFAEDVLLH